jgi:hypothetical protein
MRITGNALIALSLLAAVTSLRAQDKLKSADRNVTISGCVVAGDHADTYMLSDVKQVSGWAPTPDGPMYYWLNSTKGLKERLGQRVQVSGIVDFNDTHEGQKKITVDPSETKDTKTKVSSEGKQVTVKQDTPAVPKIDNAEKTKTKIPAAIFDLHVKTVTTVAGTCPSGK